MRRLFEQARGIGLDRPSLRSGLPGELRLNLGPDVNGDRHRGLSPAIPPTYSTLTGVKPHH
jgi:hypothetical protein